MAIARIHLAAADLPKGKQRHVCGLLLWDDQLEPNKQFWTFGPVKQTQHSPS